MDCGDVIEVVRRLIPKAYRIAELLVNHPEIRT